MRKVIDLSPALQEAIVDIVLDEGEEPRSDDDVRLVAIRHRLTPEEAEYLLAVARDAIGY